MQPFMFDAPDTFDLVAFASSIGASWQPPAKSLRRQGASIYFNVTRDESGMGITLAANGNWPWRWAAANRLQRDVLKGLARLGVRGTDPTSQRWLEPWGK